nr:MAG TPA: Major capsid protein [Caudoviricetes sp.]
MEENKDLEKEENKTAENKEVEGAGNVDTQTTEKNEGQAEIDVKAEAQKIADAMVAKKMKGMPSKEELKAFKDWQESQKTAEQKQAEKDAEYRKTLDELNTLKQTNAVLSAGVNKDDADYVLFKVSKMEGEFDENLAKFLKDNPKYLKQELEQTEPKATGAPVRTISSKNDGVLGILASKHPEINFD